MGNSERVQAADAARHCGFTFRGKATWVTETVKLLCNGLCPCGDFAQSKQAT